MRTILLVSWLLLPIGAWAYHEGPGQDRVALESTDAVLARAHEAFAKGSFKAAVREYEAALKALPKNIDAMPKSVSTASSMRAFSSRASSDSCWRLMLAGFDNSESGGNS